MSAKKILFVCLGNICRSPTAEAVFRKKSAEAELDFNLDSAGTSNNHSGERSDPRSIRHAEKRGYAMTHLARQICAEDFEIFDIILVMDQSNLKNVFSICPEKHKTKVKMLTDYCGNKHFDHVPDPYYGDARDFELVIDIIEDAWDGYRRSLS